jgi:hypothetical protein
MENCFTTVARDKPIRLLKYIGSSVLFVSLASVAYAEVREDFVKTALYSAFGAATYVAPSTSSQPIATSECVTLSQSEVLQRQKNAEDGSVINPESLAR